MDETKTKTYRRVLAPLDEIMERMDSSQDLTLDQSRTIMKDSALLLVSDEDMQKEIAWNIDEALSVLEGLAGQDNKAREAVEASTELLAFVACQLALEVGCENAEGELENFPRLRQYRDHDKKQAAKTFAVDRAKSIWDMDERRSRPPKTKTKMLTELQEEIAKNDLARTVRGKPKMWADSTIWGWLDEAGAIPASIRRPGPKS